LFFGGVSAALWNMALLGVGAAVGYNIDRLGHLLGVYGKVVVAILCVVGGAWIASRWFKNRSSSDR
jgi:membrane protein DedA with SNARE-associated domain